MSTSNKNEPSATAQPLEIAGYWTPARAELHGWLTRNAPSLAELYRGATTLVYGSYLPGRVRFVAHAVREIRNRLPDAVSGQRGSGYFHWKDRLDHLAKTWTEHGLPLDDALPGLTFTDSSPGPHGPREASLPVPIVRLTAKLLKDHTETREKPQDAAMRLFEACAPENSQLRDSLRPVVKQWVDVTEWFFRKVHDSGATDAHCDETALRQHFELFERTLNALVGRFFATAGELDEILEDTNS